MYARCTSTKRVATIGKWHKVSIRVYLEDNTSYYRQLIMFLADNTRQEHIEALKRHYKNELQYMFKNEYYLKGQQITDIEAFNYRLDGIETECKQVNAIKVKLISLDGVKVLEYIE